MSDAERRRSAKRNLTALAAVALLPLIGSSLLYWFWRPSSYVNYGELVTPLTLVAGRREPCAICRGSGCS